MAAINAGLKNEQNGITRKKIRATTTSVLITEFSYTIYETVQF